MKKRGFIVSLLTITIAAALFAQSDPLNFVQSGTATHELDSGDLVAAHAILPIGQEVLVTNLESGAQVTVTVSERIGPSSSRIIDLSTAAAMEIAMFEETGQVTIEATLRRDAPATAAAPAPAAPAPAATPAPAAAPAPTVTAATAPAITPAPAAPSVPATPAPATSAPATTTPAAPVTVAAAPAPAAPAPAAPAPAATPAPAAASAPAAPAPEAPATPTASPAPEAVTATETPAIPPPPSTGYTPTSEITPIVPPWETGYVPWPAPQNDPWLPELAQPWISGIEREQRSPRLLGPAQVPTPAYTPPPVSVTPPAPVPRQAPPPRTPGGPSVRVLPAAPGAQDRTLYRVQVGAFSARSNAQDAFNRLLNAGFSPVFEVQGGLTRVQIPWVRGDELQVIGPRLYSIGFREVLIRSER